MILAATVELKTRADSRCAARGGRSIKNDSTETVKLSAMCGPISTDLFCNVAAHERLARIVAALVNSSMNSNPNRSRFERPEINLAAWSPGALPLRR